MHRYIWALIIALVIGLGLPLLEVAFVCRQPASEACVWGRAYLPLNGVATLLILGVPTFFVVVWIFGRRRKAE